jgi:hypothetical protein
LLGNSSQQWRFFIFCAHAVVRWLILLTTELIESESESYVTTDGQSASLSWYKAPIWGLRPDFYFRTEYGIRLTVTFLISWDALSDERTCLSFVCAAGPCQSSLSGVLVPWDLRPYPTVSDLRLPFSSPPTTRRVTVEVFDPASRLFFQSRAEQSGAVAYCREPASTVTLGIEPRWDPWPYICSVSRLLFFLLSLLLLW